MLTEIEAVVNSRQITYVYNDAKQHEPLSPANFLTGKRLMSLRDSEPEKHVHLNYATPCFSDRRQKHYMGNLVK